MPNKARTVLIIICVFLLVVLAIQFIRYDRDEYNCRHMARDQEQYFESLGFDVIIARAGNFLGFNGGHVWIVLNLGGTYLHLDSVSLFPLIPPENVEYYDSYEEYLNK